jgi:hypothetical protein
MPPAAPTLFPTSARSQVWTTIISTLQSDPVLHQAVDTWQVWDGSEEATTEPTEANLPLFRMEPASATQKWADEQTHNCLMTFKISIGVAGTDITDLFDFWSAVEVALFTGNTLLDALIPFGVIQKTITGPAITPRLFGQKAGLAAEAALSVLMRIAT